jgi:hypothetical protein
LRQAIQKSKAVAVVIDQSREYVPKASISGFFG